MPQPVPALEVGPLRLWTPVVLAPMAGVTDAPFRRLCRRFGEEGLPPDLRPVHEGGPALVDDTGAGRVAIPGVDAPAGLYVCEMVTASAPTSGVRKSCDTAYRSCIGSSGRKRMTMVSGPIVSARAKTS